MERNIIITEDGSHSIEVPALNVTYHSIFGAMAESIHVYIKAGLNYYVEKNKPEKLRIFEMGFGTGLNALLTYIATENDKIIVDYTAIESDPLMIEHARKLNYCEQLRRNELQPLFLKLHETAFNKKVTLSANFSFQKLHDSLINQSTDQPFDLIYYDAFAPAAQPELWTKEIFEKMFQMLTPGGILTTYCSKGDVRRSMLAAGLAVEKLRGPKGKREMLRASKF